MKQGNTGNTGNIKINGLLLYLVVVIFICIIGVIAFNMIYRSKLPIGNIKNSSLKIRENFGVDDDITNSLIPLKAILDKYKNLEIPISITDEFNICKPWGVYENSKYLSQDNICINVDNSGMRKCLSGDNNVLSSCNNLFRNGVIDNNNTVATDNMYNVAFNKMRSGMVEIYSLKESKDAELTDKIQKATKYSDIKNQQLALINKNSVGLEDKRKLFTKKTDELENRQNQIELNQEKFNLFMDNNNKLTARLALYKKIIIGLFTVIALLLLLIYLMSNVL
jgi:hypothetical protein